MADRRRDVSAFGERAGGYDDGWLGRFHHEIADRVATLADATRPRPHRILDVGCGTGYLLRLLAERHPDVQSLVGIDASVAMIRTARAASTDERIASVAGTAEHLPFADGAFDLVVSTTSFDHWHDQLGGLRECARVLAPDGALVVADLFSSLLVPTLAGARRHKARTRRRAERLLDDAALQVAGWHKIHTLVRAFVARPAGGRMPG